MNSECQPRGTVIDYVTGRELPDTDEEPVRQMVEHFLVDEKGFDPKDIEIDFFFPFKAAGQIHRGRADLIVYQTGRPVMFLKCSRGSLVTRERESLAVSRLAFDPPIPLTVVSNGQDAEVLDTSSGKVIGEGLAAIPAPDRARTIRDTLDPVSLSPDHLDKEGRIYLAYGDFQCPAECGLDQ